MTAIVVFRKRKLLASLKGVGLWLTGSLLSLWFAHEASAKYPWQMAIVTVVSAAAVIGLLFYGLYVVRNVLLRKPLLWTDGVYLVYMAPYEIRMPLADIVAYRFDCGLRRRAVAPKGVKLVMSTGKLWYIPLGMAETSGPLIGFLRHVVGRKMDAQRPFF